MLLWIDAQYRTVPVRILVGHSLGGLFALYALGTHPDLFRIVVALSPPMWWNDGALGNDLARRIATDTVRRRTLFLASGGLEPSIDGPTTEFATKLQALAGTGNLVLSTFGYFAGDTEVQTSFSRVLLGTAALLLPGVCT